jgi:hypothetical protein
LIPTVAGGSAPNNGRGRSKTKGARALLCKSKKQKGAQNLAPLPFDKIKFCVKI